MLMITPVVAVPKAFDSAASCSYATALEAEEVVVALAMGRLVEEGGVMSSVARLADHSYAIDLDA